MRITKRVRREAKRLFRRCVDDEVLDEETARRIVQALASAGRRNRLAVLRSFGRLVKRNRDLHTARIESAAPLSQEVQASVRRDLTRLYGPGLNTTFDDRPEVIG